MTTQRSLIIDLEEAIKTGTAAKRVETLRRITDLFVDAADRYSEEQIGVFDDVLCHLIQGIESQALAELSSRLAPVDSAPIEAIRRLAHDEEISVAGPVLMQSTRLSTGDLVEIAGTKGQGHLLAISGRREVEEVVTDVLLERGQQAVRHSLAKNSGARFSETGYVRLVHSARTDEGLAERIGLRPDLPPRLRVDLLKRASDVVRSRLLAAAPPAAKADIQRILDRIASDVGQGLQASRDFSKALKTVSRMQEQGILDESVITSYATAKNYDGLVAALSTMSEAPLDLVSSVMQNVKTEGLLILGKAAGLRWACIDAIRRSGLMGGSISDVSFAEAKSAYQEASPETAHRTIRFWKVRTSAAKDAGPAAGGSAA